MSEMPETRELDMSKLLAEQAAEERVANPDVVAGADPVDPSPSQ